MNFCWWYSNNSAQTVTASNLMKQFLVILQLLSIVNPMTVWVVLCACYKINRSKNNFRVFETCFLYMTDIKTTSMLTIEAVLEIIALNVFVMSYLPTSTSRSSWIQKPTCRHATHGFWMYQSFCIKLYMIPHINLNG